MQIILPAIAPTSCANLGRLRFRSTTYPQAALFAWLLALLPTTVLATDISGVQNIALDQPRVNALLRLAPDGPPLIGTDIFDDPSFRIEAFFDTGTSGVILSEQTADFLGVHRSTGVVFTNVGIGGSSQFHVSEPLYVDVAPFTPSADVDNLATAATVYNQRFGPLRTQIGPLNAGPAFENVDILGVPTMQGKVVVMDPKPLNAFDINDPLTFDLMRTYVYNPGTPFKPASAGSDPGIPHTNRSVRLSFASFSQFTQLAPPGAEGPVQGPNPFIGPNPLAKIDPRIPADNTPGIKLRLGDKEATGSFLLDTGAQTSVISLEIAAQLGVQYHTGTSGPLDGVPLEDQFVLTLSGTGGDQEATGFFLESMLVRTEEGNLLDDNDPAHLLYHHVPVLVADISVKEPGGQLALTLDGLFGMNFLVASAVLIPPSDPSEFPTFSDLNPSPFDWIVFDPQNSVLALDVTAVPEPASFVLVLFGLGVIALRLRRARARV